MEPASVPCLRRRQSGSVCFCQIQRFRPRPHETRRQSSAFTESAGCRGGMTATRCEFAMKTGRYIVISPVRNEEKFLSLTIESMVKQTILPQQWIIVDDGSTDNTAKVATEAAQKYPWIQTVLRKDRGYRKPGGGVIEAFYDGFRE